MPSPFGNISHVSQETENYQIAIIEHEKEKNYVTMSYDVKLEICEKYLKFQSQIRIKFLSF